MIESLSFLQWIAGVGGIGAVFAVLMFFVLTRVLKIMREDRKYMEDRLTGVIADYNKAVQESTKIQSELFTYLKAKNGSKN
jgi:hypothetical protein